MAYILGACLDKASMQRAAQYGNFDKSAGRPPGQKSSFFAFWSTFKARVFGQRGWLYLAYYLGLLAVLARWNMSLALMFGSMGFTALAIGSLDFVDSTRHLMFFNFLVDMTAICAVAAVLSANRARSAEPAKLANTRV